MMITDALTNRRAIRQQRPKVPYPCFRAVALGGLRFLGEIHRLGRGNCIRWPFVGADAGLEFALAFARPDTLIQMAQYLELVSARFRVTPCILADGRFWVDFRPLQT